MAVNVLTAAGGSEAGALRDDLATPPTNGQYGTNALLQNTKATLALTSGGVVVNKNPRWESFVGLALHSNPVTSTTTCVSAGGYVEFADFQNATNTVPESSPVYANTLLDPWRVLINSASAPGCAAAAQRVVTIRNVELWFPKLLGGLEVTGTITGKYAQPGANCSAGGVELDLAQGGLVPAGSGISDGAGGNAFLCFVSANNYVFPTTPTGEGVIKGTITDN
jgi:hypothetical protein